MNTDETITIYDVAREAGVSMATVSRVVNGNKKCKRKHPKKKCLRSFDVWITVQMRLRVAWRVRKPLL